MGLLQLFFLYAYMFQHLSYPSHRWAISGTPIQNSLDDLFGLMSFLKIKPLDKRINFTSVLARPIKYNDAKGLMRLQVRGAVMHSAFSAGIRPSGKVHLPRPSRCRL